MKTIGIFLSLLLTFSITVEAQKFITKTGNISFYSSAPLEDIEAHNDQVNAALNTKTGDLVFKVLIRSFQFEKALMQEHFNENYMESHKYPASTFQGKITNMQDIDFEKEGTYTAEIEGKLTIHGVTNEISEKGTFTVKDDAIHGKTTFNVLVEDYDIKIPKAVVNNIAESIEVTVDVELKPL